MELIQYNGIQLQVVQTDYVSIVPRYDENDNFLWDDWDISVKCHVQPWATSYVAGSPPTAQYGQMPGDTLNAIRSALEAPRGPLTITAGGATILDAPQFIPGQTTSRRPCDCANGPTCQVFSIRQIIGLKDFVCHCRFRASVNPNYNSNAATVYNNDGPTRSAIVSNVWTIQETIDDLLYPVRITAGQLTLRADVMRQLQITSNTFRGEMFFPVTTNFQRMSADVDLSRDGTVLTYVVRDEGRCYNLGYGSPIRRFEGYQTGHRRSGSLTQAAAATFLDTGQSVLNNLRNFGRDPIGTGAGIILGVPGSMLSHARRSVPQYWAQCRVDLWGDRNAHRAELFRLAGALCCQQLANSVNNSIGFEEVTGRIALHEKYVSYELTRFWGRDVAVLAGDVNGDLSQLFANFYGTPANPNPDTVLYMQPSAGQTVPNRFASQGPPLDTQPAGPFDTAAQFDVNPPFGGVVPNNCQAAHYLNQSSNPLTVFITQLLMNPSQVPVPPTTRYGPAGPPAQQS